ncbi:hypothetical protein [Methylobacterium symbioticum]|uniref:hypothetical protein n=1 Tax=Methylobacterium symbioticum TaxID=2584084 RepID=UPI00115BD158|nr:hypothetical protein [Methylobacterium symbioticum]
MAIDDMAVEVGILGKLRSGDPIPFPARGRLYQGTVVGLIRRVAPGPSSAVRIAGRNTRLKRVEQLESEAQSDELRLDIECGELPAKRMQGGHWQTVTHGNLLTGQGSRNSLLYLNYQYDPPNSTGHAA